MNRQAQGVVLLLLGGAVLRASLSDLYLRYVRQGLRPFLICAGIVLVIAAIMTLWYDLRRTLDAGGDEHGHGHREPGVGWLLILPVLGLVLVAPPALGSYAAGQSGTALGSQQLSDFPPLPAGDPAQISVLDYASRAVFDEGHSIGPRRVQLTGFIMAAPDGSTYLARMVLSCCAADARPVKVGLAGDGAPTGLGPDTWVQVTGTYTAQHTTDPVNKEQIPFLTVTEWHMTKAPKNQYEG
ncbi:MAG TPA: TIGR03943 family protein [Micromonosporaceae bacterium]|nr:TIGR03943 family protein [Micromonosporaceae bacterium]